MKNKKSKRISNVCAKVCDARCGFPEGHKGRCAWDTSRVYAAAEAWAEWRVAYGGACVSAAEQELFDAVHGFGGRVK